tara:strand:- start:636 stop:932 length:297 start_codon:yes stop_codon:yes gene_type:complete
MKDKTVIKNGMLCTFNSSLWTPKTSNHWVKWCRALGMLTVLDDQVRPHDIGYSVIKAFSHRKLQTVLVNPEWLIPVTDETTLDDIKLTTTLADTSVPI